VRASKIDSYFFRLDTTHAFRFIDRSLDRINSGFRIYDHALTKSARLRFARLVSPERERNDQGHLQDRKQVSWADHKPGSEIHIQNQRHNHSNSGGPTRFASAALTPLRVVCLLDFRFVHAVLTEKRKGRESVSRPW